MRILLLASHKVGLEISHYLLDCNENIVGVGLPAIADGSNLHEIESIFTRHSNIPILRGDAAFYEESVETVRLLKPDVILCVYWPYILKENYINLPLLRCINFHAAYLPYNRGKNPNVWPIVEGTPAGVTLHFIDKGIDSGEIISQEKIDVELTDTAGTLYRKLEAAFLPLFKKTWPKIKSNNYKSYPQDTKNGSFHLAKDFTQLDEINLDAKVNPMDLINQIRSRSFPGKPGCYYRVGNKKIFIKITLEEGE